MEGDFSFYFVRLEFELVWEICMRWLNISFSSCWLLRFAVWRLFKISFMIWVRSGWYLSQTEADWFFIISALESILGNEWRLCSKFRKNAKQLSRLWLEKGSLFAFSFAINSNWVKYSWNGLNDRPFVFWVNIWS